MNSLLEKILSEIKNKESTEFFTDATYEECEKVKYAMWDDYRVEISRECKKLLVSVWKRK
jgi:hypothetical protein